MNDADFISESPQAGFHDGFLTSHVSKIGGNTVIPSSWSGDRTRPSTTEHTDDAPVATFEMSETGCAASIFEIVIIVVVVSMLLVQVSLKNCTLHVSFMSLKTQITQQMSGKSDEIDGMRLEKTLEFCQVFGLYNLAPPIVLSMNHHPP